MQSGQHQTNHQPQPCCLCVTGQHYNPAMFQPNAGSWKPDLHRCCHKRRTSTLRHIADLPVAAALNQCCRKPFFVPQGYHLCHLHLVAQRKEELASKSINLDKKWKAQSLGLHHACTAPSTAKHDSCSNNPCFAPWNHTHDTKAFVQACLRVNHISTTHYLLISDLSCP